MESGLIFNEDILKRSNKLLGEILVELGYITKDQLNIALSYQKEKGGRLGWILATLGFINRLKLYEALSLHFNIPFLKDIDVNQINRKLLKDIPFEDIMKYQFIPFKKTEKELIVLISYPTELEQKKKEFYSFLKEKFGDLTIKEYLITDLDITKLAEKLYRDKILDEAIHGLFYRRPYESAYTVFTKEQYFVFVGLLLIFCFFLILHPRNTLIFVNLIVQVLLFITVFFKLILAFSGMKNELREEVSKEEVKALKDEELPVYTILVPAYKEPEVVGILINGLKKIDYPQNKLDVILLLEEDDKETLEAAKAAKPPANWRLLIVPNSLPKTKPKACNYGLFFARGKYLVIYDSEDIPEPDQLKKAYIAFKKRGEQYVCFQGALNYFNKDENFLTRMFTLEYSYWFDYLLPGLDSLRLPIPLGGTSNHFDVDKLRKLGGWDPFNTTEDADLGIRAYMEGYKVGVINSTTFEEANARYGNWIRQRSRWIKGYMQTWLVYSRNPIKLINKVGFKAYFSFNFFIGGAPFMFLVNPILEFIFVIWLIFKPSFIYYVFPPAVLYFSIFNLLFGNFSGVYLNMLAVFKRKYYNLILYSLLNPIYWNMHSIASYKALWQLFTKPFYWEKTQHGITSQKDKIQHI